MEHVSDPAQLSFIMILLLGLSLSVLSGTMGPFVLASKTSSLIGSVSHAILAGVGVAVYFEWNQFICILVFGIFIGILIGIISIKDLENKEVVMNIIWSIGMALGVILLYQKGYDGEEIMHVLFGNIRHLNEQDIVILCVGSLSVIGLVLYCFKRFSNMVLDLKKSRDIVPSSHLTYLFLLGLISFTVILMVKFVGIVLVLSLLSLPAAIATRLTKNIHQQIFYGIILAMIMTFGGLKLSFLLYWPIGATITLFSGICYLPFLLNRKNKTI